MNYDPKRHNYINKDIEYITSSNIKEYDIKSAGFNMLISANALSNSQIEKLSKMDKEKRNKKIGIMQRNNKEITKIINSQLEYYRAKFIQENNLEDRNIISVKKDAFFLLNAKIKYDTFDNVVFRKKNKYSSYYRMNNLEFYFSKYKDQLDIKGIGNLVNKKDDVTNSHLHEDYMIKFLKKIFSLNEVSNKSACLYLKEFADKYRKGKLDLGYYRELNSDSKYRIKDYKLGSANLALDYVDSIKDINISYNYMNVILELVRLIY